MLVHLLALVLDATAVIGKRLPAVLAGIGLLTEMRVHVTTQQMRRVELHGALFACEILDTGVTQKMNLKVAGAAEVPATLLADAVTLASLPLK